MRALGYILAGVPWLAAALVIVAGVGYVRTYRGNHAAAS